ncbi:MAG: hypothetical protein IANPNBLG_04808 [Bryobacteraceae bacterium]|nr:hypothetical protein [Bryobacteraceae bacterium]
MERGARLLEGFHSATFELHELSAMFEEEVEIARPCCGDKVGIHPLGHAAEHDLHLFVEQIVIHHHLQDGSGFDAGIRHLDQLDFLVLELAGKQLARIRVGIDLPDPAAQQVAAFVDFDAGVRAAGGMSRDAGYLHDSEVEEARGRVDVARTDDDGSQSEGARVEAAVVKLVLGQRCFEDFVVDLFRELFRAFFTTGFGGGGLYWPDIIHSVPQ